MKLLPKNLYSRLTLITVATVITGYAIIYAYTNILPAEYAANAPLTSTFMGKIVGNINDLDARLTNIKACPTGMTKITDFCIDSTSVTDAAGEDQKMAMTRCAGQNKHLCGFGEYKTAWVVNSSLICPGGIGRYVTPEAFHSTSFQMLTFECVNCSLTTNGCTGSDLFSTDTTDKSRCCLNP